MSCSEMVGLSAIRFLGVVLWRSWVVWEGGIFPIIAIAVLDVDRCFWVLGYELKVWGLGKWGNCQEILIRVGLKLVKLGIFPKLRIFVGGWRGWRLCRVGIWGILWIFSLSW